MLYWLRRNRRADSNQALGAAIELANRLRLPVLALEALGCAYPYASLRLHAFALEGVAETAARLRGLGIGYWFCLERRAGEMAGRVEAVAARAAAVVVDDYPESIPAMDAGPAPRSLPAPVWAADASCVAPSALTPERAYAAYSIRPRIHKQLAEYLQPYVLPAVAAHFSAPPPEWHTDVEPGAARALARQCAVDRKVAPVSAFTGGRAEAERRLERFLDTRLWKYARDKNEPAAHATSELSPYLHYGYIAALEVALRVRERASADGLMDTEFLEELIVRRELAFNFARTARNPAAYAELPAWARKTLAEHRADRRDPLYHLTQLENAETADPLWNAAQTELLLRGKIHGYYRMYWGKKILEWTEAPEEALASMVYLNDRYALDGQDPNSYAGVLWCLGLHDRPWPQRPIYGAVRSMMRSGMERKTNWRAYVREMDFLRQTGQELEA